MTGRAPIDELPQLRGTLVYARLPLVLLAVLIPLCVATAWSPPAGRPNWLLEVGPALVGFAVLGATYRRFPMTQMAYVLVALHALILIYGGYYTYAETPLGNWAREAFHLGRNHYDRVGHLALGAFPAILVREILLRLSPLGRGGWLFFLVTSVVLAIGASWELLEWWGAVLLAPDVGTAFLGTQGDVWDAQWDIFLALVGAVASLLLLAPLHDRAMLRMAERLQAAG